MGETLISKSKLTELEQELDLLKTVKRKEMADIIKEARSHGDLSENSEYDEAKNSQAIMEARIAELEKLLSTARVIDEDELSNDRISVGSTVVLFDFDFDEQVEYAIVSSGEADPFNNKISDESPVGSALLGHNVGDVVSVELPGGDIAKYEIRSIGKQKFN